MRLAGPGGMLRGIHETLGVWHQTENQAARVANARDVINAAIRIVWELSRSGFTTGIGVDEDHLIILPQRLSYSLIGGNKLPLPVGDGQFNAVSPGQPGNLRSPDATG